MILVVETTDLAACHALRRRVFIEEQAVPEDDERDGRDSGAVHLLVSLDGRSLGAARLLLEARRRPSAGFACRPRRAA